MDTKIDFQAREVAELDPHLLLLVRRKQLPDFTPKNPKFQAAIQLWRKLPIPLTRLIGPPLVRLFP